MDNHAEKLLELLLSAGMTARLINSVVQITINNKEYYARYIPKTISYAIKLEQVIDKTESKDAIVLTFDNKCIIQLSKIEVYINDIPYTLVVRSMSFIGHLYNNMYTRSGLLTIFICCVMIILQKLSQ